MFKDQIDFWFNEVEKVISGVIDSSASGVREWKDIWMSQKGDLLPYFDENGRIEKEVKLENYSNQEQRIIVQDSFSAVANKLNSTIFKRSNDSILTRNVIDSLHSDFLNIDAVEILENKLSIDRGNFKKGTKTSKYLASMRKEAMESQSIGQDYIEKFIDNYNISLSMLLNALKNIGKIGLSINPMDFILVSAHTNGWKSCHHIENGCYRMGGISYMLDNTSVVGYAYEKTSPLSDSYFNSDEEMPLKLWRAMVFLSPDGRHHGIISRQYPSEKIIYSYAIRELVAELMGNICGVSSNYVAKAYGGMPIKQTEIFDSEHVANVVRNSYYNYVDPITSHVLLNHFKDSVDSKFSIAIGNNIIPCAICGSMRNCDEEESGSSYLMCEECDNRGIRCYDCGGNCSTDYCYDGEYYCESCYNENFSHCDHCGITVFRDDICEVRTSRYGTAYVCSDCMNDHYHYCDRCGEYYRSVEEVDVNGSIEYWCDLCVSDYAYTCEECGCLFTEVEEIEGDYYCEDCASSKFEVCDRCEEYSSEITSVGGKNYCENCLKQHCIECAECGEYTENPVFNLCDDCVKNKEMAVV
jgi:hypothetical protein